MDRLIRQYDGWEDATAADLLAWMATETTEPKSFRQNGSQLMKLLKTEVACALAEALESAGMKLVVAQIATPDGIDFGDDETQRMLTKLGESSEAFAPYVGALKALGQDTRTRWAREFGETSLPTAEEIAAEQARMLTPPDYSHRATMLSIVLRPNGKAVVSCRVTSATEDGRSGPAIATVATADADNADLPEPISAALTLIREYVESV